MPACRSLRLIQQPSDHYGFHPVTLVTKRGEGVKKQRGKVGHCFKGRSKEIIMDFTFFLHHKGVKEEAGERRKSWYEDFTLDLPELHS